MNILAGANSKKLRALRHMSGNNDLCEAADIVPSKSASINTHQSDTFSAKSGFDISTLDFVSCDVVKAIPKLPKQQRKTNCLNTGFIIDVFCMNMVKT